MSATPPSQGPIAEAVRLLTDARRVVFLTGAGISAESGVPTFRGPEGLWRSHRPEELATPEAFRRDPGLVWAWYRWRRSVVASCRPNPAHRAIARRALLQGRGVTVVTQNVDALHEAAAREEALALAAGGPTRVDPSPALPLELHGNLFRDRCTRCGRVSESPGVREGAPRGAEASADGPAPLPGCTACGGLLRPDVVWFGEALDRETLEEAFAAASAAEVCVVVGTSSLVHPAAALPLATLEAGGAVVEVNPEATPLTARATCAVRGPAAALLPAILGTPGPVMP